MGAIKDVVIGCAEMRMSMSPYDVTWDEAWKWASSKPLDALLRTEEYKVLNEANRIRALRELNTHN